MKCPACGGATTPWLRAPASEPADATAYELVRCKACGTAVTTGTAPGPAAYASGIYAHEPPRLARVLGALQRIATRLPLRAIRRAGISPGARILDAGAGRGRLVSALREHGYRAEGIDSSPRGPGITRASIEEHTADGLDAVVLWHVLEHLHDPAAALERARDWLAPSGVLLVAVPNLTSLQAWIAGPAWFHLDLPRHRTHFTARGVRELLGRTGLEPVRVYHFVPEHNLSGMWFALLSRLGVKPGFPFHLLKRNVRLSARDGARLAIAGPLLLVPALVLELLAVALRRGGTIAVIARRQPA